MIHQKRNRLIRENNKSIKQGKNTNGSIKKNNRTIGEGKDTNKSSKKNIAQRKTRHC